MACIVRQGNTLSVSIGRVIVAYIGDEQKIRVVAARTGELIREDETGELTMAEFKKKVEYYKTLCTI